MGGINVSARSARDYTDSTEITRKDLSADYADYADFFLADCPWVCVHQLRTDDQRGRCSRAGLPDPNRRGGFYLRHKTQLAIACFC